MIAEFMKNLYYTSFWKIWEGTPDWLWTLNGLLCIGVLITLVIFIGDFVRGVIERGKKKQ